MEDILLKKPNQTIIYYMIIVNAIGMMSMDIHLPVLPMITKEFNTSFFVAQQILTLFYIVGIIARVTLGPLSDAYGRKKIMLLALDIQIIGQFMQIIAPNIEILLVGRVVQALASGGLSILISAIISDLYINNDRAKMLGINELIQSIGLIIAPIIGGYLANCCGWRGGFIFLFVNLIIARIVFIFSLFETNFKLRKPSFNNAMSDYIRIITHKKFMLYSLIMSFIVSAYMIYAVISSYIYIEKFGMTTKEFMIYQTIPLAFQALSIMFYNKTKLDLKLLLNYGIIVMIFAGILSFTVIIGLLPYSPKIVMINIILVCISLGIIFPACMKFALDIFPSIKGTASSTLVVSRGIFSGFTMIIITYFNDFDLALFVGILIASILTLISWLRLIYIKNHL